jgi:hypothetical protein
MMMMMVMMMMMKELLVLEFPTSAVPSEIAEAASQALFGGCMDKMS